MEDVVTVKKILQLTRSIVSKKRYAEYQKGGKRGESSLRLGEERLG